MLCGLRGRTPHTTAGFTAPHNRATSYMQLFTTIAGGRPGFCPGFFLITPALLLGHLAVTIFFSLALLIFRLALGSFLLKSFLCVLTGLLLSLFTGHFFSSLECCFGFCLSSFLGDFLTGFFFGLTLDA